MGKRGPKKEPIVHAVILAAGIGERIKSYEPRSLLEYRGKTILEHQVDSIRKKFKRAKITIVGGIGRKKIISHLPDGCKFIENQLYESTNAGESLRLAIESSPLNNVLFLHGDIIPDINFFNDYKHYECQSTLFSENQSQIRPEEIGINETAGKVNILAYSLPAKWAQICFMEEKDTQFLRKLFLSNYETKNKLTFEIINDLIEMNNSIFQVHEAQQKFLMEVDSIKDFYYA